MKKWDSVLIRDRERDLRGWIGPRNEENQWFLGFYRTVEDPALSSYTLCFSFFSFFIFLSFNFPFIVFFSHLFCFYFHYRGASGSIALQLKLFLKGRGKFLICKLQYLLLCYVDIVLELNAKIVVELVFSFFFFFFGELRKYEIR